MSALLQAVQYCCDWCQVVSEQVPLAASGVIVDSALPDGWTSIGYGVARLEPADPKRWIKLADVRGSQICHLCPRCSTRPTGDLLIYLGSMLEKADVKAEE